MENLSEKYKNHQDKITIKVYGILSLILLVAMAIYGFQKWSEYSLIRKALAETDIHVSVLQEKAAEAESEYKSVKPDFDNLSKDINKRLESIFPAEDNYTVLTNQIDDLEEELHSKKNTFEVSSLSFDTPITGNESSYSVLPFRMTISSSPDNFRKFLHWVENSGAFTDKVRLMEIISIRLSFDDAKDLTIGSGILKFVVQINAYFQ